MPTLNNQHKYPMIVKHTGTLAYSSPDLHIELFHSKVNSHIFNKVPKLALIMFLNNLKNT